MKSKSETSPETSSSSSSIISSPPYIDRFASILSSPISSTKSTNQHHHHQHHSHSNQSSIFIPEMTHYTDTTDDEINLIQSHHDHQKQDGFGLAFKPEEVANITRSHSRNHSRPSNQPHEQEYQKKLPRGLSPPFSPTTPSPIIEHQSNLNSSILNSIQSLNHHHHQKKPPPVSIPPTLRRPIINQSISSILSQHQSSTSDQPSYHHDGGKELEIEEQLDSNRRTGRHETLTIRIDETGKVDGEGGRDRWGNRWSMEGHVLSPVISERTEPTHTTTGGTTNYSSSVTSSNHSNSSQPSSSLARLVSNNTLLRRLHHSNYPNPSDHSNTPFSPTQSHSLEPQINQSQLQDLTISSNNGDSNLIPTRPFSTMPNHRREDEEVKFSKSVQPIGVDHQVKKIKKSKLKRLNDQKDYEIANRQAQKRMERERREKMVKRRDEIVKELIQSPSNAKLIRDLGKLYFDWNQGNQNSSEPSIKLAIHYLEQSIQIENGDPLAWNVLAKAWQTLHFQHPSTTQSETNQRISNASLGFRKSIMLSTPTLPISNEYRKDYQRFLSLKKRYREAALILQEAIELKPTDPSLWFELGKMMKFWAMETNENEENQSSKKQRLERASEAFERSFELDGQEESQVELNEIKRIQEEMKEDERLKSEHQKATEMKGVQGRKFKPEMMIIPDFESLMRQKLDREKNEKMKGKETINDCKVNEAINRIHDNCNQTKEVVDRLSSIIDEEKLKKPEQVVDDLDNERTETPKQEVNKKPNTLNVNDQKQDEIHDRILENNKRVEIEPEGALEVEKKKKWDRSKQLESLDRSVWNAPEPSQLSPPAFNSVQARMSRSTVKTLNRFLSPIEDEKVSGQSMLINGLDQTRSPTPKARAPTRSSHRQPPSPSALPTPNTHPRNSVGTITPKTNQMMSPRSSQAASIRSESSTTGSAEGEKKSSHLSRNSSQSNDQVRHHRSDSNPNIRFPSSNPSHPSPNQFRSPPPPPLPLPSNQSSDLVNSQFDPHHLSPPSRSVSRFDHHHHLHSLQSISQILPLSSSRTSSQSRRGDRSSCCLPSTISKASFPLHRTTASVDSQKISPRPSSVDRSFIESILPPPKIPPRPLSQNDRFHQPPYLFSTGSYQTPNRSNSCKTKESQVSSQSRRRNGLNESCRVSEDWLGGSTAFDEEEIEEESEESLALINAHLQSIQEIDRLRREEIITLRRRFEDNEMNAERRRSEVIENLRKICSRTCTPRPRSGIGHQRSSSVIGLPKVEKSADCALNGIASILQLLQQQQQQPQSQQPQPQSQSQSQSQSKPISQSQPSQPIKPQSSSEV
ncbi:hypothetical protein DFH28DRAFT_922958 [Melampsora americana]|nr:hypothetical protein DFH28DRAFT_922958 [Melampsora americana]